jgi:hypothetical protein
MKSLGKFGCDSSRIASYCPNTIHRLLSQARVHSKNADDRQLRNQASVLESHLMVLTPPILAVLAPGADD